MDKEPVPADALELGEARLGEAPEALDAVDMVPAPGELVLVVEDAVVPVAVADQPVVGLPPVGVDVALTRDPAPQDRHELLFRAVPHDAEEHPVASLVDPEDGQLAARAPPALPPDPAGAEVALVDLDLAREGAGLGAGEPHDPAPEQRVEPVGRVVAQPRETGRFQRRDVRREEPQERPETPLRK